jgi:hypothetical protein
MSAVFLRNTLETFLRRIDQEWRQSIEIALSAVPRISGKIASNCRDVRLRQTSSRAAAEISGTNAGSRILTKWSEIAVQAHFGARKARSFSNRP